MNARKGNPGGGAGAGTTQNASKFYPNGANVAQDFAQELSTDFTYGVCRNALDHGVRTVSGDFADFVAGLAHPVTLIDKKMGAAIVPAVFSLPYAKNGNVLGLTGLALDIERQGDGPQPPAPQDAAEFLTGSGLAFCLWTTHSHTPPAPRYRVLFPLEGTLAPEFVKSAYALLVGSLPPFANVTDVSCFHPARLFFLPSVHPDRALFYQWCANVGGKRLKAVRLAEGARILKSKAEAEAATRRTLQILHKPRGQGASIIQKFNNSNRVEELLHQAGYIRKGKKWLAPNSASGVPGLVVFEDENRVYSHHSNDALNDGHAHDAFGVYALLWHDGDASAACAALRRGA